MWLFVDCLKRVEERLEQAANMMKRTCKGALPLNINHEVCRGNRFLAVESERPY